MPAPIRNAVELGSGTGLQFPFRQPVTLFPDTVPNEKIAEVMAVVAVTPAIFNVKKPSLATNGLCALFPAIELFAFVYGPAVPPMIVLVAWALESPTIPSRWKVPAPVFVRAQPSKVVLPADEELPSAATFKRFVAVEVTDVPLVNVLFIENVRSLSNCAALIIWLALNRFERAMVMELTPVVKVADAFTA